MQTALRLLLHASSVLLARAQCKTGLNTNPDVCRGGLVCNALGIQIGQLVTIDVCIENQSYETILVNDELVDVRVDGRVLAGAQLELFFSCADSSCSGQLYSGVLRIENYTALNDAGRRVNTTFSRGLTPNCRDPLSCGLITFNSSLNLPGSAGRICFGRVRAIALYNPPNPFKPPCLSAAFVRTVLLFSRDVLGDPTVQPPFFDQLLLRLSLATGLSLAELDPHLRLTANYSLSASGSTVFALDMGFALWPYLTASFLCNAFNGQNANYSYNPILEIESGLELTPRGDTAPFACRDHMPSSPPPPLPPERPSFLVVPIEHCSLRWMFFLILVFAVVAFALMLVTAVFLWCTYVAPQRSEQRNGTNTRTAKYIASPPPSPPGFSSASAAAPARPRVDPVCKHLDKANDDLRDLQALDFRTISPQMSPECARAAPVSRAATRDERARKRVPAARDGRREMGTRVLCTLVCIYVLCVIFLIVMLALAARGYSVATLCTNVD
ncbi:hypothetical protein AB1Y20_002551 [Prymnesium parvum]|uniref:Uncharacterized protein n=1 Tax=Prymnesium parvum TaxID=97485 RepID=A0AB34J9D8_PRYPA